MNKRLIAILIVSFLVGCGSKEQEVEVSNSSYTSSNQEKETAVETTTTEKKNVEEKAKLKACYGTIKDISESSVTIEGVDSKIYTGDPSGFIKLDQGEFVYFEYTSFEETESGYSVEFTNLRKQAKNFDGLTDENLK